MDLQEHMVRCWFCSAEFDLMNAPFCNHLSPSKICPFCLHCSCHAPESYQKNLWGECPRQLLEKKREWENRANFRLGEILIRAGKITSEQLKEAMEKQRILKKKLGEIVVMMDLVTPEELELYLIHQKQVEEIDLSKQRLNLSLIEKIGIDFCVLNRVIPLDEYIMDEKSVLRLAIASDMDLSQLKLNERISDYMVIPYRSEPDHLEEVLKKIQREEDMEDVLILEDDED